MKKPRHTLLASKGCGSVIVESAFILADISYQRVEVNYQKGPTRTKLLKVNPLSQVPALILPNKTILTESAAMISYIHKLNPKAKLIPSDHTLYWRWICFIIAAIYPTFTYGDEPTKWVQESAGKELRLSTDEWRKKLWLQLEAEAIGPYFLGNELSAIDLYIATMVHWRPGEAWFKGNCLKLLTIAKKVSSRPKLKKLFADNFK